MKTWVCDWHMCFEQWRWLVTPIIYVTKQMAESGDSGRQADVEILEIEVTPEMIVAGLLAFQDWVGSDADESSLVEMPSTASISSLVSSVFFSMIACRPESKRN